jgi:hypothetical protein
MVVFPAAAPGREARKRPALITPPTMPQSRQGIVCPSGLFCEAPVKLL